MDIEETTVEQTDDVAADDALPEDVVEETEESEESLDSLMDGEEEQADETPKESQGTSEPGWIKKRVGDAVQKALARQAAEMRAEFEAQMAPIREKMLNDEARELVRQGEFKSLDRAKEYLQLKQGITPAAPAEQPRGQQPRDEQGRYVPKEDPATSARIDMLRHQADTLKEKRGVDVIAEYQNNEEIRNKIINGEMDFYDVAEYMEQNRGKRKPPAPTRSPNGASGTNKPNAIDSMSDEQFDRMERNIKEKGARYTLR